MADRIGDTATKRLDVASDSGTPTNQTAGVPFPSPPHRVLSKIIERGPIVALVKQATGYKCQVCAALGQNPVAFVKPNGEAYVEAHRVSPVSRREVGSLASSNVMAVCPNHHRQMHYGGIEIAITPASFEFMIQGRLIKI